jgi:C4-dicarboxylate-specific signal transduction histidine kinase
LIVLGPEGRIVRVNRRFSIDLCAPEGEIEERVLDEWLPLEERRQLEQSLAALPWPVHSPLFERVRGAGSYAAEHRLLAKDGQYRFYWLEATLQHDPKGKEEGAVVCATDITAIKKQHDALLDSERQLKEARMQKLRADRLNAMGGMATALSHEINQPLTAIAAYLSVAHRLIGKSSSKPAGVEDALAKAVDQVARAGQIVAHMRTFVTSGEPDITNQSMHQLVRNAYEAVSVAGLVSVDVSFHVDLRDDRVLADKIQVQQVLVNLIRNAVEAMHDASWRKLTISTLATEDGMIRTEVCDTGPGLPSQIKETLFEPFKTTKASGMGIGLSISRSIIEAHHGHLWAEANPAGGAVFCFTLPMASSHESS